VWGDSRPSICRSTVVILNWPQIYSASRAPPITTILTRVYIWQCRGMYRWFPKLRCIARCLMHGKARSHLGHLNYSLPLQIYSLEPGPDRIIMIGHGNADAKLMITWCLDMNGIVTGLLPSGVLQPQPS
jgi:hypothetical protein